MANNYDPKIMDELLEKVGARVKQLTPTELAYYKNLLVKQGIYAQYVIERKLKLAERGK